MIRSAPVVLAVAFAAGLPGPSAAAEKAWLLLAADLPGEAKDLAHTDWIELVGFSAGGPLAVGQAAELEVAKRLDRASPGIFSACATGRVFQDVMIDLDAPVGDVVLCRLEFDSLAIPRTIVTAGSGTLETVKLRYSSITFTYYLPDESLSGSIDLATGQSGEGTGAGTDTDDDGMPDEWESRHGLVVGSDDAGGDLDGDGLANGDEYLVGSHPNSGSSFFVVTAAPDAASPGSLALIWKSVPGRRYEVLWSPDLATAFTPLVEITASAETTLLSVAMGDTFGFYRIRLVR